MSTTLTPAEERAFDEQIPPVPPAGETAVATAPEPEEERKGGAPSRHYVVLEEIELEQGVGYEKVITVEARNGQNALRKAFKELRKERPELDGATLVGIPAGQWKPTPVRAERKESITVAVGR